MEEEEGEGGRGGEQETTPFQPVENNRGVNSGVITPFQEIVLAHSVHTAPDVLIKIKSLFTGDIIAIYLVIDRSF